MSCRPNESGANTYAAFLRVVTSGVPARERERMDVLFRQLADHLAAEHPEVRQIADPGARLEAARRVVFGEGEATEVRRTAAGWEFSLTACPVVPLGMEFPDLCGFARILLDRLTGGDTWQQEWIIRGDPRCTFEVRAP